MSWRALTEQDLIGTLSGAEAEAFRRSSFGVPPGDPVPMLLARTCELVRGYVRSNGRVRMGAAGTVPASLVSPAVDYAVYDLLKRLPQEVGEDRRRAREQAIALFEAIAARRVTPEGADEEEESGVPAFSPEASAPPPRYL